MKKLSLAAVLAATLVFAAPAGAITFGQFDGNRHPNVGALFADWDPEVPGQDLLCTGTLISPEDFLTASHCTEFLPSLGIDPDEVFVTFDPDPLNADGTVKSSTQLLPATYDIHPEYGYSGQGGFSDPHDIAVVVLDEPYTKAAPARLPTLNQLAEMSLRNKRFTAVGYGTVREVKQAGPNALIFDGKRRFATQSFHALTKTWLKLNMNPSTGSGGTCYGDSGGPHFLGAGANETNLLVSITVTGDTACRATDVTYRLDTASARAYLDDFVTLP